MTGIRVFRSRCGPVGSSSGARETSGRGSGDRRLGDGRRIRAATRQRRVGPVCWPGLSRAARGAVAAVSGFGRAQCAAALAGSVLRPRAGVAPGLPGAAPPARGRWLPWPGRRSRGRDPRPVPGFASGGARQDWAELRQFRSGSLRSSVRFRLRGSELERPRHGPYDKSTMRTNYRIPRAVCCLLGLSVLPAVSVASVLAAADVWPQFRGPGGRGVSEAAGFPEEWGAEKNVTWKTPVPGRGLVVSGRRGLQGVPHHGRERDRRKRRRRGFTSAAIGRTRPPTSTGWWSSASISRRARPSGSPPCAGARPRAPVTSRTPTPPRPR